MTKARNEVLVVVARRPAGALSTDSVLEIAVTGSVSRGVADHGALT